MHARASRSPLAYAALFFPLVAVFEDKLIPAVLAGTLGAAAYAAWPWKPPTRSRADGLGLLVSLGLMLTWSLLSAFWSLDPGHSLARFGRLALTVAAGVLLCRLAAAVAPAVRAEVARWFAAGVLIAGALAGFRQIWLMLVPDGTVAGFLLARPVTAYNSVAVLLVLVLLATAKSRPLSWLTMAAVASAIAAIALGGTSASFAALGAAFVVYAAVMWLGRKAVRVLAVALPVAFVAAPLSLGALDLPSHFKERGWVVDGSIGHRLIIWRYVSEKVRARPVLGWGLHTSRLLPDREKRANDDPRYADIMAVTWFGPEAKIELMPMHPHNATLQLWLELGIVGAVLYAALYGVCLVGLLRVRASRTALAAGAATVAVVFVLGQLSFSAWQSWWLCAQFLVAGSYLLMARRDNVPPQIPEKR